WQRTAEVALEQRADMVLFQCPASFRATPENIGNLRHFFEHVERHGLAFAWEPRGPWPTDQVTALCRALRLVRALDPFQESRSLHQGRAAQAKTVEPGPPQLSISAGHFRYFRLHGIGGPNYRYTADDLERLAEWVSHGPACVFFNNLAMLDDARRFRDHST